MTGLFAAGDKALLLDSKKRRYLIDLGDGGEFHSHAGFVVHADIIGEREGIVVRSTKGEMIPLSSLATVTYTSGPHEGFVDFYRAIKAANPWLGDPNVLSAGKRLVRAE